MLNFLVTGVLAAKMALSQPVMQIPDTTSYVDEKVHKTELAIDYLQLNTPESVEGGKRYSFKFPQDSAIDGRKYWKAAITYTILINYEGQKKVRLTTSHITTLGELIVSSYDGYVSQEFEGPLDGVIDAVAFVEDESYWNRLGIGRRSDSPDPEHIYGKRLGTDNIEQATPYHFAIINAYIQLMKEKEIKVTGDLKP